jgi:O-antigen/teichoic acid export membrane protein
VGPVNGSNPNRGVELDAENLHDAPPASAAIKSKIGLHTAYNAVGLGAPLLVAVYTIPVLLAGLGDARFGLLTLIWAVASYFGLFDLGLGRALTQQLASSLARGQAKTAGALVGTALALMAGLGLVAGALLAVGAPWAIDLVRGVPERDELLRAALWIALAMPAIVLTSGLRGVLEARSAFGVVNLIRLPMGLFTFIGPLWVLWIAGPRLDLMAAVLALGRVLACAAHAACAYCAMPRPIDLRFEPIQVRPLVVAGGWLSISNVVSPLMGYADRFLVGALVSASAVAWYATPHELVSKLWIVPGALTAVLFPTFAAQTAMGGAGNQALFSRATDSLFAVLLPITIAIALFANEGLTWWVGPTFAAHSAPLLQVFAVGTLINCLAHVPFTLLQSAGAARLTALIHCVEMPFFMLVLWALTAHYGVMGAATAWLCRIVVDTALLFEFCRRHFGWRLEVIFSRQRLLHSGVAALGFGGLALASLAGRASLVVLAIAAAAVVLRRTLRGQN